MRSQMFTTIRAAGHANREFVQVSSARSPLSVHTDMRRVDSAQTSQVPLVMAVQPYPLLYRFRVARRESMSNVHLRRVGARLPPGLPKHEDHLRSAIL
jgi:hypothetical protein